MKVLETACNQSFKIMTFEGKFLKTLPKKAYSWACPWIEETASPQWDGEIQVSVSVPESVLAGYISNRSPEHFGPTTASSICNLRTELGRIDFIHPSSDVISLRQMHEASKVARRVMRIWYFRKNLIIHICSNHSAVHSDTECLEGYAHDISWRELEKSWPFDNMHLKSYRKIFFLNP